MESEIPRSHTPLPAHSEDDTRAGLRELQLAAVERDAQVACLEVHLHHALEDVERARAETRAVEVELAALRAKYERAKGWCVRHMDRQRKNESQEGDGGAREDSTAGRSPEEAWAGALPDPHCSRSAVALTAPLQSHSRAHAQDRDPRKRIKLDSTAAPVSRSASSARVPVSALVRAVTIKQEPGSREPSSVSSTSATAPHSAAPSALHGQPPPNPSSAHTDTAADARESAPTPRTPARPKTARGPASPAPRRRGPPTTATGALKVLGTDATSPCGSLAAPFSRTSDTLGRAILRTPAVRAPSSSRHDRRMCRRPVPPPAVMKIKPDPSEKEEVERMHLLAPSPADAPDNWLTLPITEAGVESDEARPVKAEPQPPKPPLRRLPPIWAQSRQEVVPELPTGRVSERRDDFAVSGVKGYFLSAFSAKRDMFACGGKIISSHGGGKAASSRTQSGQTTSRAADAQRAHDLSVRALIETYELFPWDLAGRGVYMADLGFYKIVHLWGPLCELVDLSTE
ncbi:hypothetical protein FB451DRAFT_1553851 [Mycena latifolia]|nr:hypothetical protein FB451DRAFT_1553851 [Mycena latifolia]